MRAGELRHRIAIQKNTPTRDEFNAEVEHWSTVASVWALVEMLSGSEFIAQQAAGAALNYKITLRDQENIDPAMIVIWKAHRLEISAILRDSHRHQMMLVCSEVV